jgi:hypothetical protein
MKRAFLILLAALMCILLCACGNGEVVAPDGKRVAGKAAGNEVTQYSFCYPEQWELIRNSGTIELKFDCNESEAVAEYATISVVGFDLAGEDAELTSKQYWNNKHKAELEGLYTDFAILNGEGDEIELGGTVALEMHYSGKISDRGYYNEQIICCRYGSVYLVTLVVPEEHKDKVADALESVVAEFEFDEGIF